jgi:hypothetical protein
MRKRDTKVGLEVRDKQWPSWENGKVREVDEEGIVVHFHKDKDFFDVRYNNKDVAHLEVIKEKKA